VTTFYVFPRDYSSGDTVFLSVRGIELPFGDSFYYQLTTTSIEGIVEQIETGQGTVGPDLNAYVALKVPDNRSFALGQALTFFAFGLSFTFQLTTDQAPDPSLRLSTERMWANEGTLIKFSIDSNLPSGSQLEYSISGVSDLDITNPLTGVLFVDNQGNAKLSFIVEIDHQNEDDELLTLEVGGRTISVLIVDSSNGAPTLALPLSPEEQAHLLYVSIYGRPGEPDGIEFYTSSMNEIGIKAVLHNRVFSTEARQRFAALRGSTSKEELKSDIETIYKQMFSTDLVKTKPLLLDYWVEQVSTGCVPFTELPLELIAAADDYEIAALKNKLQAAELFSSIIDSYDASIYQGNVAAVSAATWLSTVNEQPDSYAAAVTSLDNLFQFLSTKPLNPNSSSPSIEPTVLMVNEDSHHNVGKVIATDLDDEILGFRAELTSLNGGTLEIDSKGTLWYSPPPNFSGQDSFKVHAFDGRGGISWINISVQVNEVNKVLPSAVLVAKENALTRGNIFFDNPGEEALLTIVKNQALNGTVRIDDSNDSGSFTYEPTSGYTGTDRFTLEVNDGGKVALQTVFVSVVLNAGSFVGTESNDILSGSKGRDSLEGFGGTDAIKGYEGNDTLVGGSGSDILDGGEGTDTAIFEKARSAYKTEKLIQNNTTLWKVTDLATGDADELLNIEKLEFAKASVAGYQNLVQTEVNLDVTGTPAVTYRLYRAAFARDPDLGGLGYWISALEQYLNPKLSPEQNPYLLDVAKAFVESPEFKAKYGADVDNATYVRNLYKNTLDRDPLIPDPVTGKTDAGYTYWVGVLDAKAASRSDLFVYFSESTENKAAVAPIIATGVEYVPWLPSGG
jgi:hypothetical protein